LLGELDLLLLGWRRLVLRLLLMMTQLLRLMLRMLTGPSASRYLPLLIDLGLTLLRRERVLGIGRLLEQRLCTGLLRGLLLLVLLMVLERWRMLLLVRARVHGLLLMVERLRGLLLMAERLRGLLLMVRGTWRRLLLVLLLLLVVARLRKLLVDLSLQHWCRAHDATVEVRHHAQRLVRRVIRLPAPLSYLPLLLQHATLPHPLAVIDILLALPDGGLTSRVRGPPLPPQE
jgi:hypothetical protein